MDIPLENIKAGETWSRILSRPLPEEVEGRMTELLEWYHTIPSIRLGTWQNFMQTLRRFIHSRMETAGPGGSSCSKSA